MSNFERGKVKNLFCLMKTLNETIISQLPKLVLYIIIVVVLNITIRILLYFSRGLTNL